MYCIVLYCIVLYCIVLYCIVLYCVEGAAFRTTGGHAGSGHAAQPRGGRADRREGGELKDAEVDDLGKAMENRCFQAVGPRISSVSADFYWFLMVYGPSFYLRVSVDLSHSLCCSPERR